MNVANIRALSVIVCLLASASYPNNQRQSSAARQARPEIEAETIKLGTTMVSVSFAVRDRRGAFVDSLEKDDLQVFEDGKKQHISSFETSPFFIRSTQPIAVALVLRWQPGTMRSSSKIALAALAAWQDSLPPDSLIGIFSGTKCVLQWFTKDEALLRNASRLLTDLVERDDFCGGVAGASTAGFYRGIAEAARELNDVSPTSEGIKRRKLMFIIGDYSQIRRPFWPEYNNLWYSNYSESLKQAKAASIDVYAAMTQDHRAGAEWWGDVRYLEHFIDQVGGRIVNLSGSYKAETGGFGNIYAELQHSYQVSYSPSRTQLDGKFHKIKLQLRQPDLKVVGAREGYWAFTDDQFADQNPDFDETLTPTKDDRPREQPGIVLKRRQSSRDGNTAPDLMIGLDHDMQPIDDQVAPLQAMIHLESYQLLRDGNHTADVSFWFDYRSFRVSRNWSARVDRETREVWFWPLHDYANLDLWIELFRRDESMPISQMQRTLNIFADLKQSHQYQLTGVKHVESFVLPQGKYWMRVAARETMSGRLVKLNKAIEVNELGVKVRPDTEADGGDAELPGPLLDRPVASSSSISGQNERGPHPDGTLNVALLIDAHELMRRNQLQTLASMVGRSLSALEPTDRTGVVAVNDHATQVLAFTGYHRLAPDAINRILLSPSDWTAINDYEAFASTANGMMASIAGRNVMIWLTDLNNNLREYYGHAIERDILRKRPESRIYVDDHDLDFAPYDQSLEAVRASKTTFYAVVLPSRFPALKFWENMRDKRKDKLRKFAEATGGALFTLKQIDELPSILSRIIQEQHSGKPLNKR
jgi:VWFA-related protein